jgi:hypothetical protein
MSYDSIPWLALAAALTALGMVLSYIAWQRRGVRPAVRIAAWSLLPIAAYLTGAIEMLWKIGVAIGDFATAFVFSPAKWAGIALAGLAFVLIVATGNRARRRAAREERKAARADRKNAAGAAASAPGVTAAGAPATSVLPATRTPEPVKSKTPAKGAGRASAPSTDDDDLKDIEEILRQRGI